MKKVCVFAVVLSFALFASGTVIAAEEEHQIPVAPQEFLDMENPNDEDDVDEDFLKKAGRYYKTKCKKCHGPEGDGKGSASAEIEIKPTAFNAPGYLESRSDGQLFWVTLNGSEGTEMKAFGPESDAGYSEERIWQLVSFIRASFTK